MTERRSLLIRAGRPALIVLGLALAILLIVNSDPFDQEPDVGTVGEVASESTVHTSENAAIDLLELAAASGRESSGRAGSEDPGLDQDWLDRYPGASCNPRSQLGCLARLREDLARAPVEDARLLMLIDRYRAARRRAHFDESAVLRSGSAVQPEYAMALRLARINIAVQLERFGVDAALAELQADRAFWERVLRQGDSMLARMVAVAGLWSQLQFVAELVQAGTLSLDQLRVADATVLSLPEDALDLGPAFATEQRSLPSALDDLRAQQPLIRRAFIALTLQPNATLNRFNRQLTRPMIELAGASPEAFRMRVDEGLQPDFGHRVMPPGLFNLGGTMLLQPFRSHRPWDYIGRIHDLSGMLGLVRLQIEIERSSNGTMGLESDVVQRVVDDSRERDPYTGQIVQWDRDTQTLGFDCYGESVCQVRVRGPLRQLASST